MLNFDQRRRHTSVPALSSISWVLNFPIPTICALSPIALYSLPATRVLLSSKQQGRNRVIQKVALIDVSGLAKTRGISHI